MGEIEFDDLHFTECNLGAPALEGDDLIVPIAQLYIVRGEPGRMESEGPCSGRLIFRGVVSSHGQRHEYVGAPSSGRGFRPAYVVENLSRAETEDARIFMLEGVQREPDAWVTWAVQARAFVCALD